MKPFHVDGMIFSGVILGQKFVMITGKKREQIAVDFFNELTQSFLSNNLPENKFHKKLRKIIINVYPKLSRHHPKIMYKNIVHTDMNKSILHIIIEMILLIHFRIRKENFVR